MIATTTTTTAPITTATTALSALSQRDRAVLRAVAAGRCVLAGLQGMALRIDGIGCADQFAGLRLAAAGLIAASAGTGLALTPAGRAELGIG
jgi:hypothetical protein